MRNAWVALGVALMVACGGPVRRMAKPPPSVAARPPPPYLVASSSALAVMAADASHLYWNDGEAFYRRGHGPTHAIERLYVSAAYVSLFAVGSDDVYFVDDSLRLRALPKTGGAPSDLAAGLDEAPIAIAGDGDGVIAAFGDRLHRYSREPSERSYPLAGTPTTLAVAAGVAYATVRDADRVSLLAIELGTGKTTTISSAPELLDALALAVSGDRLIAQLPDGVVTMPRTGGAPVRTVSGAAFALAADDAGYAVAGNQVIVTHRDGHAPRVAAHGSAERNIPGAYVVAVGGAYVYYSSFQGSYGDGAVHATPREDGATLMRLPGDAALTAIAAHRDRLYVAVERGDARTQVVEVTDRKTRVIADPAPGYVDLLGAGAEHLLVGVGPVLHAIELDSGDSVTVAELGYLAPPVEHKGNVFWSQEGQVWARALPPRGDRVLVADALRLGDVVAADLRLFELGFADDHVYFVVNLGTTQGLARADEAHRVEWVWTWPRVDEGVYLDTGLVLTGDAAYVTDAEQVYRIPLAGGAATTVFEIAAAEDETLTAAREVLGLLGAGDHLVVHTRSHGGEQLRALPRTGAPRIVWETAADPATLGFLTAGDDAVYVHLPELAAIARIPLGP